MCTFLVGMFKYAFCMTEALISRSLKVALKNTRLRFSLDTTLQQKDSLETSLLSPPDTNLAFLVSDIRFLLKIMLTSMLLLYKEVLPFLGNSNSILKF